MNVQFKCWYWKSNEIQVLKYRNHSNQAGIVIYWQEHIQHVQPKKQEKRFKCTGIIKKPHWKCDKFRKHIMEFPLPKFERCEFYVLCYSVMCDLTIATIWFMKILIIYEVVYKDMQQVHCHNFILNSCLQSSHLWCICSWYVICM